MQLITNIRIVFKLFVIIQIVDENVFQCEAGFILNELVFNVYNVTIQRGLEMHKTFR
ncbi:hypothetical protein D3C72_2481850 [compost metagenome]